MISKQISSIIGKNKRQKRGIANFVGDISKTLFDTLNDNDLQRINHELDKLYMDNRNIAVALSNHTKILNMLLDTSSADYKRLLTRVNEDSKTANKLRNIVDDSVTSCVRLRLQLRVIKYLDSSTG